MKNENGAKTISVGRHQTKTYSTGVIKVGRQKRVELPPLRVIELPRSFISQEVGERQRHGRVDKHAVLEKMRENALLDMCILVFEPMSGLTKKPPFEQAAKWSRFYKNKGSFYQTIKHLNHIKDPIKKFQTYTDQMVLQKQSNKKVSSENLPQLFRRSRWLLSKDENELSLADEKEIDWLLNKFVELDLEMLKKHAQSGKKNLRGIAKETRERFLGDLRKRIPDKQKRDNYLKIVGLKMELVWFRVLEDIAKKFATELKGHATDKEITLFMLLNTRQGFWGNRIPWYDFRHGLLNLWDFDKEFKLLAAIVATKVYGIKKVEGYNLENFLNETIKRHLQIALFYRQLTHLDEKEKGRQRKRRKYGQELSFDQYISTDSADTFWDRFAGKENLEADYQSKEVVEKMKKMLSPRELQVLKLLQEGFNQSEIAKKLNCTKQNINKIIKSLRKKLKPFKQSNSS